MQNQNRLPKKRQGHRGIVLDSKVKSKKIRYGAPDGPRPEGSENYDGHTPIKWPGLESVAQHVASPKSVKEFRSDKDLAKNFDVTRNTIQRWKHHPDVSKRVHWLSNRYRLAGDSLARINWPRIMEKVVAKAMKGDMQAIKFCEEIAWRQEKHLEKREISPYSLEESLERAEREYEKHYNSMTPTWLKERAKRLASRKPPAPALPYVEPPTPKAEPAPEAALVNSCDACGKMRCAHGRCPMCEICADCE
jgi:hypothetical protein